MAKIKNQQNNTQNSYTNVFNYFDNDFYGFLNLVEKTKIPKKIRFKTKKSYYITAPEASEIKKFINTHGIKYKGKQLNKLFLQDPMQIRNILKHK